MKLIPNNKYYILYAKKGKSVHRKRISAELYNKSHLGEDHLYYNASTEEIIKMQKYLKEKGLYNGAIDGYWGPETEKAYKMNLNVGRIHNIVSKLFNINNSGLRLPYDPVGKSNRITDQCAAYVNKILEDNGIDSWGDAPSINKQFRNVYSGYSDIPIELLDVSNLPINERIDRVLELHHQAARNVALNLNVDKLDKTHVYTVNMYFGLNRRNASSYLLEYYDKGIANKSPGSHEGVLYYDPSNGWMVNHAIHGKVYNEPVTDVLGDSNLYGIISVADAGKILDKSFTEIQEEKKRAKEKEEAIIKMHYESRSPYIGPHFRKGGKLLPKAQSGMLLGPFLHPIFMKPPKNVSYTVSSLKSNLSKESNIYDSSENYRNIITKEFNLTPEEFDLIKGVLPHIAKRESSNGKGIDYNFRNSFINLVGPNAAEGVFNIAKKWARGNTSPLSLGPYQMKYDIFVNDPIYKDLFNKYKISKNDIIKDNGKATLAALIKLAGDYNILKTLKLINKNGNTIPYDAALKFIWHYGPQSNWLKVEVLNDRYVRDKLF